MKQILCFFAILSFAVASSHAQTDLIAQIHFLGGDKISADPNSPGFTNDFCSAEARALKDQTLDKLSAAPATWFESKLPTHAIDCSKELRPLLDDFLKSEWVFEMRDATNGSPEYALAIRLDNSRVQLWNTNLRTLIESWTTMRAQDTSDGWRLKKDLPPNLFQFSRSGDWVILDCGQNELPLGNELAASTAKNTDTNWLMAKVDWPRLARLYPALRPFDFPRIQLQITGGNGNLMVNGRLNLAQPLAPLPEWQIPTNELHQPFDSFTAGRGFGSWLKQQSWFAPFQLQPQPEQFFVWALPQFPFTTFAAEPVPDANAALTQLGQRLMTDTDWRRHFIMPVKTTLADGKLLFVGVPFMSPYIQAEHERNGNFLLGGFFPNPPVTGILPDDLLKELGISTLVYYHWENTRDRLQELPQLSQLILMITQRQQVDAKSAGALWLKQIEPSLGASITAAAMSGPQEVTFVRMAPTGLTALELLGLVDWLDSPNFPARPSP